MFKNAFSTTSQIIINTLILFFLYKVVVDSEGMEALGIWSLVLGSISIAKLAEFGMSASVTRFVAKKKGENDNHSAALVIQTAVVSLLALLLVLTVPIKIVVSKMLLFSLGQEYASLISGLMPMLLLILIVNMVSSIFSAALDGLSRFDLRALVQVTGQLVYLFCVLYFIGDHGIYGLAYALIAQSAYVISVTYVVLKANLNELPIIPLRWKYSLFREMLSYNAQIQASGIAMFLFEPVTKMYLARFGDVALVGYYEISNQLVIKARSLLVAANQVVVPKVASAGSSEENPVSELYQKNIQLLLTVLLPCLAMLASSSPIIGRLWIDSGITQFLQTTYVLIVVWGINTLNVPAYFMNQGEGKIRFNTYSHFVAAILNVSVGYLFGSIWGGAGVIVAMSISLVLSSILVIYEFHRRKEISFSVFFRFRYIVGLTLVVIGAMSGYWFISWGEESKVYSVFLIVMVILTSLAYMYVFLKDEFFRKASGLSWKI